MQVVSNVLFTSILLSILIMIVINYVLSEYSIESKDQLKTFIYVFITSISTLLFYKMYVVEKCVGEAIGGSNPIDDVFTEIEDSKLYNRFSNIEINGGDELIIDNIPNITDKIINSC